ncbi:GNAT family N-acetyltransferase [uncultured Desulfobulbus sp.]|uniref:GNAT family N-acetyltransferase n=1 Tax=uncultured Desulfobulbus sp. TaxID=239745 RepID=UPI0029C6C148|nr:GNAT family N-acetyltransferase [uncultured Desulfobulbus sp.]
MIILVNNLSDHQERVRARKIGQIANRELQHDGPIYHESESADSRDIHLYLYVSDVRVVGFAIFEKRDYVSKYTWDEYDKKIEKELKEHSPIWSLGLIWFHKKYRKTGVATHLFQICLNHLKIGINDIGLYTPFTKEGEAWARATFEKEFIIAK